jgi:hypothetical protein
VLAKRPVLASCVAACALLIAAHAQVAPLFHFTEKPGPYPVGLKVVAQYDYSRTYRNLTDDLGKPYQGERGRPLQALIWYPAQQEDLRPQAPLSSVAVGCSFRRILGCRRCFAIAGYPPEPSSVRLRVSQYTTPVNRAVAITTANWYQ